MTSTLAAEAAAPFHDDVTTAPRDGVIRWLHASDGVRIRVGYWRGGGKGTVLLFPGRTEYIEKYGPAAGELIARGFSVLIVDWRGQGLADRPLRDARTGHVHHFQDYQRDIAALLDHIGRAGLPQPLFLLSHSMGGAIALRALLNGLPVRAASFSAPMWGISMHSALRPVAWALSTIGSRAGQGHQYAPGTSPTTYVLEAPYAGNVLTTDPTMYAYMQHQVQEHPDLALGGPSLQWLNTALFECLDLRRRPSPAVPCYTALGLLERVVDPRAVRARMAHWPGAELGLYPQAEHEVMMELPATRRTFYDATVALFDRVLAGVRS